MESYYQYFLKVVRRHKQTSWMWLFPAMRSFSAWLSLIVLIILWLAKDLQTTSTAFLLSSICWSSVAAWFSSARAFWDIYVVVTENFQKFFFFNCYLISSSQHNFRIFKKPFVFKKWSKLVSKSLSVSSHCSSKALIPFRRRDARFLFSYILPWFLFLRWDS